MDEHILTTLFDQPNSSRATPYLRGLAHVVQQQRIDYILARTNRCKKRRGRLLAYSTVWLVIAMSLFRHPLDSDGLAFFASLHHHS